MLPIIASIQEAQSEMLKQFGLDDDLDFDGLTEEERTQLIEFATDTIKSLDCPTIIMGSRLENPQGFRGMLELARSAAEQGMRNLPAELEMVREFWKVVEEEDNFLLTVDVDMSKLPWHKLLEEVDPDEMQMALAIRDAVSEKRATVAMGIVDNLLILGIARDRDRLTGFGNGAKLIDLDDLRPLRKAIDQNEKLVSVFYMSQQYAQASYSLENFYDQIKPMIRPILNEIDEIPSDEKEPLATRIESEAREFLTDIEQFMPPRAMTLGFASLHDDGLHGYSRAALKHPMLDGSKPLNLAKHAGPDTIAFFNQRLHRLTDQYDLASKWASRLYGYARDFGMDQLEEELGRSKAETEVADDTNLAAKATAKAAVKAEQESLDEFNQDLLDGKDRPSSAENKLTDLESDSRDVETEESNDEPDFETIKSFISEVESLVTRFDTVTKQLLLPAIDGQEAGLFLEAVSGPNPWHPDMPIADKPLPMPLPAIVMGTNDAKAVVEAGSAYWKLIDDLLTSAKKHFPEDDLQEAFLLPPNRIEKNGDVSFRWSFLHDFGQVDSSVQPGSLINENWVVLNLHPDQAKRLTVPQSENQLFGPANTDEPSIGIAFYDHRVVMKSVRTWIDFAETQIPPDESPFNLAERYPAERDTLQFTEPQLRDAFERVWTFAKCFQGLSIRSYEDGNATVSESLLKFEDIAAE